MKSAETYAVVVLYYRAGPTVWDTVRKISEQSLTPVEIVVVDNGSHDGVCDSVPADLHVRVATSPTNQGYSGGLAFGAQHLRKSATWVLFATHEVKLDNTCAETLVREASRLGAAQAGPAVLEGDERRRWSLGGSLTTFGNTTHAPMLATTGASPREVDWLEGCCHLVRRELITEQLFDRRYFLYWDDVDMSTQLRVHGPVICVPTAICSQSTSGQMTYFASRNRIMYWRKQRRSLLVALAVGGNLARAVRDLTRYNGLDQARSRLMGLVDGMTGRLSPRYWTSRSA